MNLVDKVQNAAVARATC